MEMFLYRSSKSLPYGWVLYTFLVPEAWFLDRNVMARNMTGSNMIPLGSTLGAGGTLKAAPTVPGVSLLMPSYLAGSNVKQEKSEGESVS